MEIEPYYAAVISSFRYPAGTESDSGPSIYIRNMDIGVYVTYTLLITRTGLHDQDIEVSDGSVKKILKSSDLLSPFSIEHRSK